MHCPVCRSAACDDPEGHRNLWWLSDAPRWTPKSILSAPFKPLSLQPVPSLFGSSAPSFGDLVEDAPHFGGGAALFNDRDGIVPLFDVRRSSARKPELSLPRPLRPQLRSLYVRLSALKRDGKVTASVVIFQRPAQIGGKSRDPDQLIDLKFDRGFREQLVERLMKALPDLTEGVQLDRCKLLVEVPVECVYLLEKWFKALMVRQTFLQTGMSSGERVRLSRLQVATTKVQQELTHYGELPHTLRHWLRGGQVALSCASPEIPYEWSASMRTQWCTMLQQLKLKSEAPENYCDVFEHTEPPGEKINHTDLQYYHLDSSPELFFKHLQEELAFPQWLAKTDGYEAITEEVSRLWKKAYDNDSVGAIMWVRFVSSTLDGNLNREIEGYELQGCLQAAKGLAATSSCKRVLVLGDQGALERFDTFRQDKDVPVLLGAHLTDKSGKRRTQLQQLQFLAAIVSISRAKIVLGERSGSVDKLSLCGGIPCCQFVAKNVRQGNARLDEVFALGCGMGFNVSLKQCLGTDTVRSTIIAGGNRALTEWRDLVAALQRWQKF